MDSIVNAIIALAIIITLNNIVLIAGLWRFSDEVRREIRKLRETDS